MDISEIQTNDRTIDIVNPGTKKKLGISVTIMSTDDDRMKKCRRSIQNARLQLERRGKTFSAEEIEQNRHLVAFTSIIAWNWGVDPDGEQALYKGEVPDLNKRNAYDIFNTIPWFRDQIDEEISESEAFFLKPNQD